MYHFALYSSIRENAIFVVSSRYPFYPLNSQSYFFSASIKIFNSFNPIYTIIRIIHQPINQSTNCTAIYLLDRELILIVLFSSAFVYHVNKEQTIFN